MEVLEYSLNFLKIANERFGVRAGFALFLQIAIDEDNSISFKIKYLDNTFRITNDTAFHTIQNIYFDHTFRNISEFRSLRRNYPEISGQIMRIIINNRSKHWELYPRDTQLDNFLNDTDLLSEEIKIIQNDDTPYKLTDQTTCSLCLESLESLHTLENCELNCGHIFHCKCIEEYINYQRNIIDDYQIKCPMCRQRILSVFYKNIETTRIMNLHNNNNFGNNLKSKVMKQLIKYEKYLFSLK